MSKWYRIGGVEYPVDGAAERGERNLTFFLYLFVFVTGNLKFISSYWISFQAILHFQCMIGICRTLELNEQSSFTWSNLSCIYWSIRLPRLSWDSFSAHSLFITSSVPSFCHNTKLPSKVLCIFDRSYHFDFFQNMGGLSLCYFLGQTTKILNFCLSKIKVTRKTMTTDDTILPAINYR